MDFYQINDLERLSGVKAHTIRIWEKRYALIQPYRTETNIRFYDDEQLKKLLNVAVLAASGFRISKIAGFSAEQFKIELTRLYEHKEISTQYEMFVNGFIAAMLDFDEVAFEELCHQVFKKYGVELAMSRIIYPFLNKTGVLWRMDEAMPVQEHFASMLIKRKLLYLISSVPKHQLNKPPFLLFLPANEWHEIGLLFAEYMIRMHGAHTVNLGQNVPMFDIEYVISKTQPCYLLTFLINDVHTVPINQLSQILQEKYPQLSCLLCGPERTTATYEGAPSMKILRSPTDILNFL